MVDVLDFVIARYNYWIVIVLMMTGLYTVFSRGNLVKTVIGLNIFQTSVFIFYITIGKVAGGTAPILIGGHAEEEGHGAPHGEGAHAAAGHAAPDHDAAGHGAEILPGAEVGHADLPGGGDQLGGAEVGVDPEHAELLIEATRAVPVGDPPGVEAVEIMRGAGDVLYSNPLPHVLILTAIVVGVATTAVGLAIAVRIKEAYGTVEEDALEAMDNAASFGDAQPEGAPAS
ncbi:sodium:proton antiporter [Parvularcula oceani]|uniref:sodium:proton antiporter n=1 Tax=Parvularcula oceani TaxID=1247963 RepID=UPI000559CCC6|nr:cation:proton antiporter subunit C [Parvularcula oceani]